MRLLPPSDLLSLSTPPVSLSPTHPIALHVVTANKHHRKTISSTSITGSAEVGSGGQEMDMVAEVDIREVARGRKWEDVGIDPPRKRSANRAIIQVVVFARC